MQNISCEDFFEPTPYNAVTKNQIWLSQIQDSHDNICYCGSAFAHLLASIFPPGHKDRDLTINQILCRDYTKKCLSGGREGESHGLDDGDTERHATIKEEDKEEKDIEDALMAAAAAAAEDKR